MLIWRFQESICASRGEPNGGSNMAFRKPRDTAEHDQPADTKVEGEIREFVRRDGLANPEPQPESESYLVASNINAVLQRATATSVQEHREAYRRAASLERHAAPRGSTGSARNRTVFEPDPSRSAVDQDHY